MDFLCVQGLVSLTRHISESWRSFLIHVTNSFRLYSKRTHVLIFKQLQRIFLVLSFIPANTSLLEFIIYFLYLTSISEVLCRIFVIIFYFCFNNISTFHVRKVCKPCILISIVNYRNFFVWLPSNYICCFPCSALRYDVMLNRIAVRNSSPLSKERHARVIASGRRSHVDKSSVLWLQEDTCMYASKERSIPFNGGARDLKTCTCFITLLHGSF